MKSSPFSSSLPCKASKKLPSTSYSQSCSVDGSAEINRDTCCRSAAEMGSAVLSLVLENCPQLTQEAFDEFLIAPKNSEAAVKAGHKLDLFLKHNASPNQYTHSGKTPFTKAIEDHRPWLLNRLISTPGLKPELANLSGPSALDMAILEGNIPAFRKVRASTHPVQPETVQWAADCGEPGMMRALLRQAFIQPTPAQEQMLLHQAKWQQQNIQDLKAALSKNELQQRLWNNVSGRIPILLTEQQRSLKVLALIRAGAETDFASPQYQRRPLHWAAIKNYPGAVKALVQAGANLDAVEMDNITPLYWAANNGHSEIVKCLIQAKANVNISDNKGNSPLMVAADHNHGEIVKILLKAGANVNQANHDRRSALHEAVFHGFSDIAMQLAEAGAELNQTDRFGKPPLHWAVFQGNFETIKVLLEAGADVHKVDNFNKTPLFSAIELARDDIANLLRQFGAEE